MNHEFTVNTYNTSRWGLLFADGAYRELVKAPARKADPIAMDWADQDGMEIDRAYNHYESKTMSLPVFIEAANEQQLLLRYNQFVAEVILTGGDIILDCLFLGRRFSLRYQSTSGTIWAENCVSFNLELIDDYPATITPIP